MKALNGNFQFLEVKHHPFQHFGTTFANFSRKIFEILNFKSTYPLFHIWVFISYENLVVFVINTFFKN
jgi:hypothetical protein